MNKALFACLVLALALLSGCDLADDDRGDFGGTVRGDVTLSLRGNSARATPTVLELLDNTNTDTRVVSVLVSPVGSRAVLPTAPGRVNLTDWRATNPALWNGEVADTDFTAMLSVSDRGGFYYARSGEVLVESVTVHEVRGRMSFVAATGFESSSPSVEVELTFRALR